MCKEFGPPRSLVVESVDDPVAGAGQVVVDVRAAGVNFPDVLIIQNLYQLKPALPFSPGSEVAGVVSSVGPGVEHPAVGDRVIVITGYGGFAERIVAPAGAALPVPEGMDLVTASGFVMAYGTSYHALHDRAHLRPGETLLVLGAAGGVGLAAVELGAAMGAVVIAAASSPDKLAVCREHGAAVTIDYTTENLRDRLREVTTGNGVDVVYDPVGGDLSEAALRSMAWGGRFLVVGFAAGTIPRIPLNLPLLKGSSVVGVFWGAFTMRQPEEYRRQLAELAELWRDGKLHPLVSRTYPLEQAADALEDLAARRATGKIVLVTGSGRRATSPDRPR
jgi:NADPH2:quinone reductase